MNLFISGTDTSVGKTVVSAILCLKLGWKYWKPIQSGTIQETDSDWVSKRIGAQNIIPEIYRLQKPLSPHLAAQLENITIDEGLILDASKHLDHTIIEGAGGLLVPINNDVLMIDLIQKLQIPLILAARSGLGTINHTLLSLEAIRKRSIPFMGVLMIGEKNLENRKAIESYGKAPVLGEVPFLADLERQSIQNAGTSIILQEDLDANRKHTDSDHEKSTVARTLVEQSFLP